MSLQHVTYSGEGGGFSMSIPVGSTAGKERLVSKNRLRALMGARQTQFFERAGGWVVIGRDQDSFLCKNQP
jgi:hypothetical protein